MEINVKLRLAQFATDSLEKNETAEPQENAPNGFN
jgi:hypothetical protein